jgi:pimeloyl-ACP methyl ester carboxylesterase
VTAGETVDDGGAYMSGEFQERRWRSADGLNLYARDYPASSGPVLLPVICLHGLTRNSKDFEALAPWIASQGRRVIVPDIRGRGRSEYDLQPMRYLPKTYVKDVLSLLDRLGISRAVFVGTSMGGLITMMLGAINRRRIAAAILNDIGPEVAPEGLARIASYAGKPVKVATWDEAVEYVRRINEPAFPHYTDGDWRRFAHRTFRENAAGIPALDYDPAISEPLRAGRVKASPFIAWLLFRRLASRPILLIRGETSDILSHRTATLMKARADNLTLVEIDGVGHAPMLDEEQAKEAIGNFLAAIP